MRTTIAVLLLCSLAAAGGKSLTLYKTHKLSPTTVGISCESGATPQALSGVPGVLVVTCGKE